MQIQSAFLDAVHLFFPHICAGCGSDMLDQNQQLCLRCLSQLPVTNFFAQPQNPVEEKFYGRLPLQSAASAYYFTKDSLLQNLVYGLKYRGNKDIGYYMGKLMAKYLVDNERFSNVDVLVPLPLNAKRQRKRGFNQAQVLCEGIAAVWKRPIAAKAIVRKVYTETQTQRDRIERWKNMSGVFAVADTAALENKHILLVDDVVTTGASLEACGAEIVKVPGVTLSIATLACTF